MATANNKNDPRGSRWRKWDLQVHIKGTNKNDQFKSKTFEKFCVTLFKKASEKKIAAIGVTDYFSIENYKKVKGFADSIDSRGGFTGEEKAQVKNILLLPNVELRMMPVTDKGRLVNIHCIFNPDYADILENNFFGSIEYAAGLGKKYKMNKQGLIDLGKSQDSSLDNEAAYKKGVDTFVVTHSDLQKLLDENRSFRENVIIAVSNSNRDGASAFQKHYDLFEDTAPGSLDAVRKSIYSISGCIFSGNEEDTKYFLGLKKDNEETVKEKCGSIKPCIHGSDAHTEDNLFSPDQNKFCWIKADPTFEGLKQIIYEPDERVKIQSHNPDEDHTKYVLAQLEIKSSETNLLVPQKILLNRNLVSIIGGKGTGKSSLLALVANSSEMYNPHPAFEDKSTEVDFQFINKDGDSQNYSLDVSQKNNGHTLPILYIEQEELAKKSSKKTEVRQAYLNEIGIEDISINYSELSVQIDSFLNQVVGQEELIDELKEKVGYNPYEHGENFEKFLKEKITKRKEIIKLTGTKSTKELIDSITEIIKFGRKLNQWFQNSDFTKIEVGIQNVNRVISSFNLEIKKFGISENLEEINIKSNKDKFLSIKKQVEDRLKESRKEYSSKKKELEEAGVKEDIPTLLKTLENIQNEVTLFEETQEKYNEAKEKITNIRNEIVGLFKADSEKGILKKVDEAKTSIQKKYKSFYQQRKDSEIFNILFEGVNVKPDVFFDVNQLEKEITNCFFKDHVKHIKKEIFGDSESTYQNYCKWVSDKFWIFFQEHLGKNNFKTRIVGEELDGKSRILEIVFQNWHDYISVSTAIKNDFSGKMKEIKDMSTGELATVLLKLKLVTEGLDKQIILLDQPEDHLDNDFIANGLVDLMKKLKLERQVIIATHNANLVVGADSEQVIVANFNQSDKKYFAGSLENPMIREAIVNILEGGRTAFEKRMNRYDLVKN